MRGPASPIGRVGNEAPCNVVGRPYGAAALTCPCPNLFLSLPPCSSGVFYRCLQFVVGIVDWRARPPEWAKMEWCCEGETAAALRKRIPLLGRGAEGSAPARGAPVPVSAASVAQAGAVFITAGATPAA